jgi:hypothetical protein
LIAVPDEKKRLALADQADKGAWSFRDLEIQIRDLLWDTRTEKRDGRSPLLSVPEPGSFYTYRIIQPETIHSRSNERLIDLGFSTVLELNRVSAKTVSADALEASPKDARGSYSLAEIKPRGAAAEALLYTYQAFAERSDGLIRSSAEVSVMEMEPRS